MMGKYKNFTPYKHQTCIQYRIPQYKLQVLKTGSLAIYKTTKASADTKQHNFMHTVSNHYSLAIFLCLLLKYLLYILG